MRAYRIFGGAVLVALALLSLVQVHVKSTEEEVEAVQLAFLSVSGVLRADFKSVDFNNGSIVAGDAYGGLTLWSYASKKAEFKAMTRTNSSSNKDDEVKQVTLFANGSRCAQLNSNPNRIVVHSVGNTTLTKQFEQAVDFVHFAISNESQRLYSVSGNKLQIWNITSSGISLLFTNTTNDSTLYRGVDASPDGKYVAAGSRDKLVLFNVTAIDKLDYLNVANQLKSTENYFNVKFLPNDTHLVTTNGQYLMHWEYNDTTLRIRANSRLSGPVFTLAVSPSGKYIVCNNKQLLDFYEVFKFELTNQKESTAHFADEIAYTSDNNVSISVFEKALSVFVVDYTASNDSDIIKTSVDDYLPSPNHYGQVYTANFGPSGFLVSTSWNIENLKLWRLTGSNLELLQSESIRQPGIFVTPDLKLTASDISPNGLHVATAGSNPYDIIMFTLNGTKLENKTRTSSNLSHTAQVTDIKFTNDSTHLVSAGLDGNIILWEVVQKKELNALCNNTIRRPGFANIRLSKSGEFVIASHLQVDNNTIANISIWHIDYTKKKITLVNETRNSEAHNE